MRLRRTHPGRIPPSVAVPFIRKIARDALTAGQAGTCLRIPAYVEPSNGLLPRSRSRREARFQAAAKSLNSHLHHIVGAVDKAGLNGLVDYACVLGLEFDGHVRFSVLRVTLRQWGVDRRHQGRTEAASTVCPFSGALKEFVDNRVFSIVFH